MASARMSCECIRFELACVHREVVTDEGAIDVFI